MLFYFHLFKDLFRGSLRVGFRKLARLDVKASESVQVYFAAPDAAGVGEHPRAPERSRRPAAVA